MAGYTTGIAQEIAKLANGYLQRTPAELERMFISEMRARRGEGIPVRGDAADFWRGVRDRFVREIIRNRIAVSTIVGHATGMALDYFKSLNINLEANKIAISLFVAIVVKATLDELAERYSPEG